MQWWLLAPAFLIFCGGAVCTYTKSIRDSNWYLPSFVALSLAAGWLWVVCSRQLNNTNGILLFSLIWDGLMVLAYYAGPLVIKGERLDWQAYAAAALTVTGICWFKMATSSN